MSRPNNKVVITDRSSGIGRAVAPSIAERDAKALIAGCRVAPVEETAADHSDVAVLVVNVAAPDNGNIAFPLRRSIR